MNDYHHGDLRNALIVAAAQLIEESGSSDFSMIDASRRAGVSNAAPYRHFKDKEALINAVCELAFLALANATDTAGAELNKGTAGHIVALGKAYIGFVKDHPAFYGLMWGDSGPKNFENNGAQLTVSGFNTLVESVQLLCDEAGIKDETAALTLAAKLWGLVHGLSSLTLNQHLETLIPNADVYSLLESSTLIFLKALTDETID